MLNFLFYFSLMAKRYPKTNVCFFQGNHNQGSSYQCQLEQPLRSILSFFSFSLCFEGSPISQIKNAAFIGKMEKRTCNSSLTIWELLACEHASRSEHSSGQPHTIKFKETILFIKNLQHKLKNKINENLICLVISKPVNEAQE